MKKIIFLILNFTIFTFVHAEQNLEYYITKAIENNLSLNAERKNFESAKLMPF